MGPYQFNPDDAYRFAKEMGQRVKRRGKELQLRNCPYCNPDNDTYTFSISLDDGRFKCLRASCGVKGNMITLAKDFNFSLGHNADEYYRQQRQYRDLRKYPVPETKPAAVEYLEGRGISKAIAEKYHITTRKDNDNILIFPFYDDDNALQFIKYRNADPKPGESKEWCESRCRPILFGMDQCDPDRGTLVLTEGQIDSLSVAEAFDGNINAVSVPTGAKGFTWVPYCWDFMGKYPELIVFGDHENGEITLLDEMSKQFHGIVKHVRPEDYRECKDANELLQKHGREAVRNAVEHAEIVEHPRIKRLADVKRQDLSQLEKINTGIVSLNKKIGGFYFGQLILLTGERGQGKSTLASQFGAQAVDQGHSVMFYSGEMPEWCFQDWFERQLAGRRSINTLVSNLEYESYKVDAAKADKIRAWYQDQVYLYTNDILNGEEESSTLIETLETSIKQYGCRVLVIDNLMTAIEDDMRSDIYRQQTQFVKQLTVMAKRYNVIIILVVHPRKRYGNEFGNDDVSGSANITNLADVVLRYTRPKDDNDETKRVLQIFKNRLNGKLDFDGIPLFYQDCSKRISEDTFDWEFGWEKSGNRFWRDVDESDEVPW